MDNKVHSLSTIPIHPLNAILPGTALITLPNTRCGNTMRSSGNLLQHKSTMSHDNSCEEAALHMASHSIPQRTKAYHSMPSVSGAASPYRTTQYDSPPCIPRAIPAASSPETSMQRQPTTTNNYQQLPTTITAIAEL